jgi:nanoRNase/pAp phosphatase (c-di-AMP/oligoRNAs hydrolase)
MISIPEEVNQILRILEDSKTICVTGHVLPDGDCIGSQLALAYAL